MDELYKVVHILKNMSQVKMRDTAVLFRMNCDKERFIKMLDKEGIVYHGKSILNGTAVSVIKHSKSLDTVLMMAAAVVGEEDDSVISGLLLSSSGKKSRHSKLVSFLQGEGLFSADAHFIPNHEKVVHRLRNLVASKSANITCKSLIGEYLSKLHKIAKQNGMAQQLSSVMKEFKVQKTKDISEFLEFVAQSADLAGGLKKFHAHEKLEIEMKNTARGVYVGTVHSAKGREWNAVILPLVDEGVIPSERTDIEEERRVLYVAITRAIESVVLTCSSKPSPFFADLGIKSTFSVNEITDGLCN
jgi:DNA helicase-2/ATP-dependent DNA helicase PcrA